MFEAMIVACHLQNADACLKITDNWGPYNTHEKCEERLGSMEETLVDIWNKHHFPFAVKHRVCTLATKGEQT